MVRSIFAVGVVALLLAAMPALAQENSMSDTVRYEIGWDNPASQLYTVRVTAAVDDGPVVFSLPAWRPGRYIIQNYAANAQNVRAEDDAGNPLEVEWADLDSWRVEPGDADRVTLIYEWYAATFDAGSSFLRPGLAYFNPINLLPWVEGRKDAPTHLTVEVPEEWPIATQLQRADEHGEFVAHDYHALVDAPTIASPENTRWEFTLHDVPYYVVMRPLPPLGDHTKESILSDIEAITREQTAMFFGAPYEEYWHLYQFVPYRFGHAVEHTNSASYVLHDQAFQSRNAYLGFLGVTAHEVFHVWNVKRLRPEPLWPYDYSEPQLTRLHWFTEGVTSYYDNLTLVRADLVSEEEYFGMLERGIQALQNTPGRLVTPVSLASWTSWHSGYGAGNPNQSVSFYNKGALVGLLLDLAIRDATDGEKSFDDVMRNLYTRYYREGKGMPEEAVEAVSSEIAGRDLRPFFDAYVHGVEELPYDSLLAVVGLTAERVEDDDRPAATLGLATRRQGSAVTIVNVLPGSPALEAGIMRDDVLVSIDGATPEDADLDPILADHEPGEAVTVVVRRGGEELSKEVTLEGGGDLVWRVSPVDEPTERQTRMREDWLASSVDRTE